LFDVGGAWGERNKGDRIKWDWIFDSWASRPMDAVIFCAALSEYDQASLKDENQVSTPNLKDLI
jgi:hypothetical protein